MWPFKANDSLEKTGILRGFTDWHSHILPGVDDGIPELSDSLDVLGFYESVGVKDVWLTPHIMEDCPNTTSLLKERFSRLQESWTGDVRLHLASENMLDGLFEERLAADDILPIGVEGKHLLVETSYFSPPMGLDRILKSILSSGYFPVLAHPERYCYMEERDYHKYKEMGILFQTNMTSLVGGYGVTVRKKSEWLLKNGMVDLLGSDLHRLDGFVARLRQPLSNKSVVRMLRERDFVI